MSYKNIPVVIVAGIGAKTRAIGNKNQLLFHVPDDLKRFKELSMGHPIILGRKTFESVVTRDESYKHEGAKVAHSLEKAFDVATSEYPREIHIGGGAEMYKQALPYVDKLFLTLFDNETEGDSTFPEYKDDFIEITRHEPREYNGLKYEWIDFERK
jgi:dihydrofolate reductase